MTQLLIQMSGVPGSGKSTIAYGIAKVLDAIVLDHDDTKSAIMSTGIENNRSGAASYEVIKTLADRFLSSGNTVIIDSPCRYEELLYFGQSVAEKYGIPYRYIECRINDLVELNQRLQRRKSKRSQLKDLDHSFKVHGKGPTRDAREAVLEWADNMKRPVGEFLIIDTTLPLSECIEQALRYVSS